MMKRGFVANLLGVVSVLALVGCSQVDRPTGIRETTPRIHHFVVDTPYLRLAPAFVARVRESEVRTAWVVQLHTEAIREAIAERRKWRKKHLKDRTRICEQAMRVGFKYAKKANVVLGHAAGTDRDNLPAVVSALKDRDQCTAELSKILPAGMSVFAVPRSAAGAPAPRQSSALTSALGAMQGAFEGSGSLGANIATAMESVAQEAYTTLSSEEIDVVIGHGGLAISSLGEWQSLWDSGTWGGGGGGGGEDPMSIFGKAPARQLEWIIPTMQLYWYFNFNPVAQEVAKWDAAGFVAGFMGGGWGGGFISAAVGSIAAYR
jgi:hypothetical protein